MDTANLTVSSVQKLILVYEILPQTEQFRQHSVKMNLKKVIYASHSLPKNRQKKRCNVPLTPGAIKFLDPLFGFKYEKYELNCYNENIFSSLELLSQINTSCPCE